MKAQRRGRLAGRGITQLFECFFNVLIFNFPMEKSLKLKATVSTFLFCALVLTVLVFIKIAFLPFQRRINTPKSH